MNNKKTSTRQKFNDPVTRAAIRIIGSIFTILSGIILFADKIFYFNFTNNFGFTDSQTFVWVFTQSVSPLIIIFGSMFKPYRIAYLVPIYFYTIQLYWVFDPVLKLDDYLLHLYAVGVCFLVVVATFLLNRYFTRSVKTRNHQITLLEEMLDFSLEINKKRRNE